MSSGISFTLAPKKGFVKPIPPASTDAQASTGGIPVAKPTVIPLPAGESIGTKRVSTAERLEAPFDPKHYGLQIRRSNTPKADAGARQALPPGKSGSEEEQLKSDLASLPDAPSSREYSHVPVEDFGKAMLRGMGWDEQKAKQKKAEQAPRPRPAMLGLGAKLGDPSLVRRPDYISNRGARKTDAAGKGTAIAAGSRVIITQGAHSHMQATVRRIAKDMAQLVLASEEAVSVDALHIELLTSKTESVRPPATEAVLDHIAAPYSSIRVQIGGKSMDEGRLYLKSATILDTHEGLCTLRLDDGRVAEQVPFRVLRPIVPQTGHTAMILSGQHAGHLAIFLGRDPQSGHCTLQLAEDESVVQALPVSSLSAV